MSSIKEIYLEEIDKVTPKKRKVTAPESSYGRSESPSSDLRFISLSLLLVFVMLFLLSRLVFLQVIEGAKNLTQSYGNSVRSSFIRAERGVIYDRNGMVLARNKPGFSIQLNTNECNNFCPGVIATLSKIVIIDDAYVREQMENGYSQVTLASGLTRDDILKVETRISSLPGVSTQVGPIRNYLFPESFAHVLGFIGDGGASDKEGKAGIEKSYDKYLHGVPGSKIIEINASSTNFNQISEVPSKPGKNVSLFIDKDLQVEGYRILKEIVDAKKALGGAIVASDPSNGGVIALVSYPSFDPNLFSTGISKVEYEKLTSDPRKPFFNRTISSAHPPGSTFKMVTSLAALEGGVITANSLVDCPPYISVGSFVFKDWYTGGRGKIDLKRALQVSCDTFFYTISGGYGGQKGVGIEAIASTARKLGFGKKIGIDIDGETGGVFPDENFKLKLTGEKWYLGDTYITSIGQGDILATPLQVNAMTSFFASKGRIYRPRIVKSIEGEEALQAELILNDQVDEEYISVIREGLRMAASPGGTAYPLFDFEKSHPGVVLAGKTGTAEFGTTAVNQKGGIEENYGGKSTHAWFTVFGPFDKPNIVLTVFLEGGGGGSSDAAPIAKKLLDIWFKSGAQ